MGSTPNLSVIRAFACATLVGLLLAQDICGQMRRQRPQVEPSVHRVMALVLGGLPALVAALGTRRCRGVFTRLEAALWREGVNPNPGRPYAITRRAAELQHAA